MSYISAEISPKMIPPALPLCKRRAVKRHCLSAGIYIPLFLFASIVATSAIAQTMAATPVGGKLDASKVSGSLIGIQYENWFYGPKSWNTAEALPLLGKYTSDSSIFQEHFTEFHELGIDWMLIDWSNMLWAKPAWEKHTADTAKLEQTTATLFQTAAALHKAGKYAPKMVFMVGLQNGPPVPDGVQRLNQMISWLKVNYLSRPEYKDLWLYDGGKPLLVVLYWPRHPCSQLESDLRKTPLVAPDWTVRWMASQLQDNHAERCGMWSWMDGTIPQIVTRHDGRAEDLVVTPSSFQLPGRGWTDPSAIGRDHGVTYLNSWKAAFVSRPKFIQIHQWNEFAGQQNGQGLPADYWGEHEKPSVDASAVRGERPRSEVYADEYNLPLSDDLEPTQLKACTYRGCGGWGYYYFNLTRAIVSLYRGQTPDITVLALSSDTPESVTSTQPKAHLHWSTLGKQPASYSISLDGVPVARKLTGTEYTLDLAGVAPGTHDIQLRADGVHTYFDLNAARKTSKSAKPLPVVSDLVVKYSPNPARKKTN